MINLVNESQFPFEPVNVASPLSAIYRLFKLTRVKQTIALSAHMTCSPLINTALYS